MVLRGISGGEAAAFRGIGPPLQLADMMSLHVLHVVESLARDAGAVLISVSGLVEQLRVEDMTAEVVSAEEGANDADARVNALREAARHADLVHIHGWEHTAARVVAEWATKQGKPYVLSPLGAFSAHPGAHVGWVTRWRSRRR